MKADLYLDIDGVLLQKNGELPDGLEDFLQFTVEYFNCFWLTTHCKGDCNTALRYLSSYCSEYTIEFLKKLKASNWETLKTEAIDFSHPFFWLDDQPFEAEKMVLETHCCSNQLIIVDLNRHQELERIMNQLRASLLPS